MKALFAAPWRLGDLVRFHSQFYGANNAEIAIVGDFDADAVRALLTELFGDWKSAQPYTRVVAADALPLAGESEPNDVAAKPLGTAGGVLRGSGGGEQGERQQDRDEQAGVAHGISVGQARRWPPAYEACSKEPPSQ